MCPSIMSYRCSICDKDLSRKDNLLRHQKLVHSKQVEVVEDDRHFNMEPLQHPFRMVVVAPSFAGKTTFVCNLLKQSKNTISIPTQRIIWCYSQYQPLYDRFKREIQNIEFHSGIPDEISEDYFLDTKVNNLIVLDDLMTEVKNDTRIGDIFSRG